MKCLDHYNFIKIIICISCFLTTKIVSQQNKFEKKLEEIRIKYDIPAIAAAVIRTDKIEKIAAVGIKKMGSKNKVNINHKFHIGSCGKSFTGMIAQKLVDEKIINWQARPIDIFPELNKVIHQDLEEITFLDLLTHRAGIPGYSYWNEKEKIPKYTGTESEKRIKTSFWQLKQAPESELGIFKYSNMGYVIAASMMEKKTGKSWEELVEQYVFKPLNINSFGYGRPALNDKQQPWGHWMRFIGKTPQEPVAPDQYSLESVERPAGDVHLSFLDFAKYAQFHLRGLQGKLGNYSQSFFESIHTIRDEYSLGWSSSYRNGKKCSIHFGSEATFFAVMVVFHDVDLAIVIVATSATPEAKRGVNNLLLELF